MEIRIADRIIGRKYPPFIVAEMSGNHNQSLERALKIIEAAAKSGVHAVKLQTYTADTMTIDIEEEKIGIFGSYARGDVREGSDIDIVVELENPDLFYMSHLLREVGKECQ